MPNKITKTSKNTNCLKGMKCPKCGQEDSLEIEATCIFTVTDDGTEDEGHGHDWEETNYCECPDCGHHGSVADFTIEEWGREKATTAPDLLAAAQALLGQWGKGNLSQAVQALQRAVNMELVLSCVS
jgi:Zn ribbon nucleic-acid-binding protein